MCMADVLCEWEGKLLLPPLVRRPAGGWVEQGPPRCTCGSTRFLVGWLACGCRDDVVGPGHRTWTCRDCDARMAVGCRGQTGFGPIEGYGCGRPASLHSTSEG